MKDEQINPLDYFAAEIRQDRAAGHGAEALAGALGARYTLAAKTICRAAGAHYHQIATAEKVKGWAEAAALSISDFTTMAALDAEIAGAIREDIETYRENSGYYMIEDLEEEAGTVVRLSRDSWGIERALIRRAVSSFLSGGYGHAERQESSKAAAKGTGYAAGWYESQSYTHFEVKPDFAVVGYYHDGRLSYLDVMTLAEYEDGYQDDSRQGGTLPPPPYGIGIAGIHVPGERGADALGAE